MSKIDTWIERSKLSVKKTLSKRAKIDCIGNELASIDEVLAQSEHILQKLRTKIQNIENINIKFIKLVGGLKAQTTAAAPSRANLQDVYESKTVCNVCMTEREGKDFVYLNNCTHTFCKYCVTRAKPQYRCMECREPTSEFFAIIKCGERHKLKNYDVFYNFIEDRPMRPEECSPRNHLRTEITTVPIPGRLENNTVMIVCPSNVRLANVFSSEYPDTSNASTNGHEPAISRPSSSDLPVTEPDAEASDASDPTANRQEPSMSIPPGSNMIFIELTEC